MSTQLEASGPLNSDSPLVIGEWNPDGARVPGEYCSAISLFDGAGRAVPAELCFRHLAHKRWEFRLLSHAAERAIELARADLIFEERLYYGRASGDRKFSLPLSDGSAGPISGSPKTASSALPTFGTWCSHLA